VQHIPTEVAAAAATTTATTTVATATPGAAAVNFPLRGSAGASPFSK